MKTYTIGRNPSADIILTANFCSRDHAKLTVSDSGKILLQDTSSNGTTVNGKKIINQTVEVHYGDTILFAGVEALDWSAIQKPEIKPTEPAAPHPATPSIKRHALKATLALAAIVLLLLVFRFVTSINSTKEEQLLTATDIYHRYRNAVALVEVQYYVRIETKAGNIYFGLKGDEIGFSNNKADLAPLSSQGTAFFTDSNGTLVTNLHVVKPWQYNKDLSRYFYKKVIPAIKKVLAENGWGNDTPEPYGEQQAIYIYPNGKTFSPHNRIECSIKKLSDTENMDLATIQTISGKLPIGVLVISSGNFEVDDSKIQVGAPAYVISFPYGYELATNESNELNCTATQGAFTQPPAKNYVQYSAAVASGSSGSPVFNAYGQLVAVTYQGSTTGQGFNRGILAKHISLVK